MNAIEENEFVNGFRTIAQTLPKAKAVICISAHWFIKGTKVTAMELPKTIHDFDGFPKELYNVQYPAKGSPALANEIKQLLHPTAVELNYDWGLDHGTWSVVKHLYPDADVPVVQLSIDYTKPPLFHYQLAKKLSGLREQGVLIIGSGNIIHNLNLVDFENIGKVDYGYDWAVEAGEKINTWLLSDNHQAIIDYENQGRAIQLAAPTPDHFLPMLSILGLKEKHESITLFNDKLLAGALSMTSFKIS